MPLKTDAGGQPSMGKLEREGVSPRRCISYEGLGEYGGGKAAPKSAPKSGSKPSGGLASVPMRKGGGY
jgi:hypothetical protein